jgi:serine/threonine-protein kinase
MSSDLLDPGADELSLACRIDSACDRFETAWKSGNLPRIEDYLNEIAAPERPVLACELILLDIYYRRLAGQTCVVNDYESRFPELDPTWLAGVISSGTGGSPTPSAAHPPDAPANGLTTANNGETIAPLPTGSLQSFGDYEIRGVIGESGMGVVYKAWQRSLNRFVALKTIRHGRGLSRSAVERFRAEAEMAAHLDHPNILPIYEVNEHEGQPYFTMKLIEGVDLARLPPHFTEDQRAVARLVATAARAVHHAHQRGILHRDLKPANILLEWPAGTDRPPVPHVADFGLAKRLDVEMHLSLEDGLVGTPVYMAPEQALRKPDLTTAVDVHGLGAVLYFLLTGQPPFKAETILETVQQVIEREPVRPRPLKPGVDRDLEIICLRCLEKRPQDRLRSAEVVAEELELWLAGKPIRLRSTSTPEKILKWVRRRPAVAALLGVSAVAMLALVGVGVGLWYSAQLQTANEGLIEAREKLASTNRELETAIGQKEVANGQLENALKDVRLEKNEVDKQRQALEKANHEKDVAYKKLDDATKDIRDATKDIRHEKAEVEKQRQLARRFLYVSQINLADRAHKEGKPGLALQFLEALRPQQLGGEDLRGPEWFHLWKACNGYAFALTGHTSSITTMEFSSDGKWLAASAAEGRVIIWSTDGAKVHQSIQCRTAAASALQFTEDSRIVMAIGEKTSLGAWDVNTGRQLAGSPDSPNGEGDPTVSLALAHFSSTRQDRQAAADAWREWKHERYTSVADLVGAGVALPQMTAIVSQAWNFRPSQSERARRVASSLAVTPNYRFAIVGFGRTLGSRMQSESPKGEVIVVDLGLQRLLDYGRQPGIPIRSVAISSSGRFVGWGGEDLIIRVKDLEGRQGIKSYAFNSTPVQLAFSSDHQYLASAHADHTIRIWKLLPSKVQEVLKVPGPLNNIVFSPTGKQLAGCFRGTTRVWDIPSLKELYTVQDFRVLPGGRQSSFQRLAYSADGRWLSDGQRIMDAFTGNELSRLDPSPQASGTAFSPDGTLVATAGTSDSVLVWERATGKVIHNLKALPPWVVCVAFSPDGKMLAAGTSTGSGHAGGVRVWDVITGREVYTFSPENRSTYSVAFSPDGEWLAVGCSGSYNDDMFPLPGEIKILDTRTWNEVFSLEGHTNCVWWVAFSPDGQRLASAAGRWANNTRDKGPGEVKIWDLTRGQELITLRGDSDCAYGVSFSPNGKVLASGSADGTIRLWGDLTGTMR